MLHTCWCIGFVCLNSNFLLNSFVCCFSKISKTLFFLLSLLIQFRPIFVWALNPQTLPELPLLLSRGRLACTAQPAQQHNRPSAARVASRRRPLSPIGGARVSFPTFRRPRPGLGRRRHLRLGHASLGVARTPRSARPLYKPPPRNPTREP
jgi:hypothetical protein